MNYPVARPFVILFALFSTLLAACQSVPGKQGLVEKNLQGAQITTKELRFVLNSFVGKFADNVEQAADQIKSQSKDPNVQRNALMWKINAISACYRAALVEDPLLGYVDTTILCWQMDLFFKTGAGAELFGDQQPIAIKTSDDLKQAILQFGSTVTSSAEALSRRDTLTREYAEQQPIRSLYFIREAPIRWYLDKFKPETQGVLEVVGGSAETLLDLQNLLVLYSAHLPKEARWQAELALMDLPETGGVLLKLQESDSINQSVQRIVKVAEQTPDLVRQERQIVLDNIDKQQVEIMDKLEKMLHGSFEDVTKERTAVLVDFQDQRDVILKQLAVERAIALKEIDSISQRRMDDAEQRGVLLIDHAYWRILQLLAVLAVVLVAVALVMLVRRAARAR